MAFVEKTFTVDENVGSVNVCVNLTRPTIDILDERVNVFVIDNSSSIYIPPGAPLASESSHNILHRFIISSLNESTKVQNPRRNSYAVNSSYGAMHIHNIHSRCVYTAHARTSASLPRVGLRLYLACFTPVAPVASL